MSRYQIRYTIIDKRTGEYGRTAIKDCDTARELYAKNAELRTQTYECAPWLDYAADWYVLDLDTGKYRQLDDNECENLVDFVMDSFDIDYPRDSAEEHV